MRFPVRILSVRHFVSLGIAYAALLCSAPCPASADTIETFDGTTIDSATYSRFGGGTFTQNGALTIDTSGGGTSELVTNFLTISVGQSVQVDARVDSVDFGGRFSAVFLGLQANVSNLSGGGRETLLTLRDFNQTSIFWDTLTNGSGGGAPPFPAQVAAIGQAYTLRLDWTTADRMTASIFGAGGNLLSQSTRPNVGDLPSQMHVVLGTSGAVGTFDNLRTGPNAMPVLGPAAAPLPSAAGAGLALLGGLALARARRRREAVA